MTAAGLPPFAVVIPTVGRPSLRVLVEALDGAGGPRPSAVVVVDDRPGPVEPLELHDPPSLRGLLRVCRSGGRGPAAARNVGWRATDARWVSFLDDDVVPERRWFADLASDLGAATPDVAGTQGRIRVPLPAGRPPTDWERNTAGLTEALWATADMAYRRDVLRAVGGFDERFGRAYREDSDLAVRVRAAGYRLVRGRRAVLHPVRPADRWVSVRMQAGNADDVLMRRLHGPLWRELAGAPRGHRPRHLLTTAAAAGAVALLPFHRRAAATAAAGWLLATTELAVSRIRPGPRTREEVATMVATSAVLPAAAAYHWVRGLWRHRNAQPLTP